MPMRGIRIHFKSQKKTKTSRYTALHSLVTNGNRTWSVYALSVPGMSVEPYAYGSAARRRGSLNQMQPQTFVII